MGIPKVRWKRCKLKEERSKPLFLETATNDIEFVETFEHCIKKLIYRRKATRNKIRRKTK